MSKDGVKLLKTLFSEIRHQSSTKKIHSSNLANYILDQSRKHQVTDERLCKAREELKYLGETYACYLRSQRNYADIQKKYHGRGERTVEETANIVGFKLPHDPK